LTVNGRRGCLLPRPWRYTRTYVPRSMLCFGIPSRSTWLFYISGISQIHVGMFPICRTSLEKKKRGGLAKVRRRREIEVLQEGRSKKKKERMPSLSNKGERQHSKKKKPLTISTLPNPTPTIILPTRIPHNHTRPILNLRRKPRRRIRQIRLRRTRLKRESLHQRKHIRLTRRGRRSSRGGSGGSENRGLC
jgi:hypothetical protein